MEWLEDFFANKLVAPLLLALLILAGAGLAIQTVRINGVSILGWYAVDGYKPLYEAALLDNSSLKNSVGNLSHGLDVCNASITSLKTASDALNKATQALIEQRLKEAELFQSRINAVMALKSTGAKCPSVDTIYETGFK